MQFKPAEGPKERYTIVLRPGVREFISVASQHFELIIYTAAAQIYADPIIDSLDREGYYFSKRLYRQHCERRYLSGGLEVFVKQLQCIGDRKYMESMLVDDNRMQVQANSQRSI